MFAEKLSQEDSICGYVLGSSKTFCLVYMSMTKIISQNTYMHLNTSSMVYNACRKVVARWLHSDFMWLCTLEFKSFLSCLHDWICLAPCMRTYSILHLMLIHWDLYKYLHKQGVTDHIPARDKIMER